MLGQATQLASQRAQASCAVLPPAITHHLSRPALNPDERNSDVQVYLQFPAYTPRARALQLLCHQVRRSLILANSKLSYSSWLQHTTHSADRSS